MGALRGSFFGERGGGDEAQGDVPDLDGLPEDGAAVWQGSTEPPGARAADLCEFHGAFLSCDVSASSSSYSVQLPSTGSDARASSCWYKIMHQYLLILATRQSMADCW